MRLDFTKVRKLQNGAFYTLLFLLLVLLSVHVNTNTSFRKPVLSTDYKHNDLTQYSTSVACAPQCANATPTGCDRLEKSRITSPTCLPLDPQTELTKQVIETVLGLPIDGRCDMSSEGGCGRILDYDAGLRYWGGDWPPRGYTMIGRARLLNLKGAIESVNRKNIAGVIVELGVWRGGAMMLAAAINKQSHHKRHIYLFDTFASISNYAYASDFIAVSENDVRGAFDELGLLDNRIHFVKGLFAQTLPSWSVSENIAVLRIDSNFYDSYQDAMYYLFDKVSVGGIIIFDDILSHAPVMNFWKDFTKDQNLDVKLVQIDFHSAWFRKLKTSKLDWYHFKAPRDVNVGASGIHLCPIEIKQRSGGTCHESWDAT